MGQRLNIEIVGNGEVLANSYYHWSGYTGSAIGLTLQILDKIDTIDATMPLLHAAVELLQYTGAGLNRSEKTRVLSEMSGIYDGIQFKDANSRNEGLLSVTREGIQDTRCWEEGRVTLDITNRTINFNVQSVYTKEEFEEYCDDYDFYELPEITFDCANIQFDNFTDLESFYDESPDWFRTRDGSCVRWIR